MKQLSTIHIAALFVLAVGGCQTQESMTDSPDRHVISARLEDSGTKAVMEGIPNSLNLVTKWQGHEHINVFYKMTDTYNSTTPTVQVSEITDDGYGATFTYKVPEEWDKSDVYDVKLFTTPCFPKLVGNKIYYNASIVREPLSEFQVPVYSEGKISADGKLNATFHHYYTYELLHISNESDSDIEFSLLGFEGTLWYKEKGSLCIDDGSFVVDASSTKQPQRESTPITIKPGESQIIVSAYIPNGNAIDGARMVTRINGEYVYSSNTKSSEVSLKQGHAYHMYAYWNGTELKFGKEPELIDELGIGFTHLDMEEDGGYGFTTGREGHLKLETTNSSVATATETDDIGEPHVEILALSIGSAIITVTDTNTGQKSQIEVVVTERTNFGLAIEVGETNSVTMKNEDGEYEAYSEDDGIATCEVNGNRVFVTGRRNGETTIHVLEKKSNKQYRISVLVYGDGPQVTTPEAVDLGLSVKWASFNLGATNPEEFGDYYAWGETVPYYCSQDPLIWRPGKETGYDWQSYKWCMGSSNTFTKYCWASSRGYKGFTDTKTILDPEDDAAHMSLGGKWRMPRDSEFGELLNNCSWEWTSVNGVDGFKVTGPSGASIFFPAAGRRYGTNLNFPGARGYYLSSSLDAVDASNAWGMYFFSERAGTGSYNSRCDGRTIRPVYGDAAISVSSITLNKTELELPIGGSSTLVATIIPENATDKGVSWSSDNDSVVSVSSSGVVKGLAAGSAVITVTTSDGGKTATCNVTVTVAVPEAIDLGLPSGLKWASFNLGASRPEEYGDYYAWGETEPYYVSKDPLIWKKGKAGYVWASYKWCMGTRYSMTKYCSNPDYGSGLVDNRYLLDPEDDAAHVCLGDNWRIPTQSEFAELLDECTWEWTTVNGVYGRMGTGPNGKSIFLPAAGIFNSSGFTDFGWSGFLWSSSLDNTENRSDCAFALRYYSDSMEWNRYFYRIYGFPIRPVQGDPATSGR